jgi:hypothetical protein
MALRNSTANVVSRNKTLPNSPETSAPRSSASPKDLIVIFPSEPSPLDGMRQFGGRLTPEQDDQFKTEVREIAKDLAALFGLTPTMYEKYFPIPNAEADVIHNTIEIDPRFPVEVLYGVIYHEAGHLMFANRMKAGESERNAEFEADVFAGYMSAYTGHSPKAMTDWLKQFPSEPTHGLVSEREEAVNMGVVLGRTQQTFDACEEQIKALNERIQSASTESELAPLRQEASQIARVYGAAVAEMKDALNIEEEYERQLGGYPNLYHFVDKYRSHLQTLESLRQFSGDARPGFRGMLHHLLAE